MEPPLDPEALPERTLQLAGSDYAPCRYCTVLVKKQAGLPVCPECRRWKVFLAPVIQRLDALLALLGKK